MDTPLEPDIILRRIDKPRYRGWKRGEHYFVEAYFRLYSAPVAIAFVTVQRSHRRILHAHVDFVFVPRFYRGEGYATTILDACRRRWRKLSFAVPKTPGGVAFLSAYRMRNGLKPPTPRAQRHKKS